MDEVYFMKKNIRYLTVLLSFITLLFFTIQCDGSKEKPDEKGGDAQKQVEFQQEAKAQSTTSLPKKLLNLGLTDEQRAKCEAAYQEIFTPEILAQQEEVVQKLKKMEKGSDEYKKIEKEISKKSKQHNDQLNEKLRGILTKEQQDKYFGVKVKRDSNASAKPVKSKPAKVESESPDDQYETIDTPFGKIKKKIEK
jgi:hypothetical protein